MISAQSVIDVLTITAKNHGMAVEKIEFENRDVHGIRAGNEVISFQSWQIPSTNDDLIDFVRKKLNIA